MLLQGPMFNDYEWPITSIKQLRRLQRAVHKRVPAICILCGDELEYNPVVGRYIRKSGELGGCGAQFETGSVHHRLDNGRRSHRYAGGSAAYAIKG